MTHDLDTPAPDKGDLIAAPPAPLPSRLASIDAYRGLVMFLMLAEALHLCGVAENFPDSPIWQSLCLNQSHVEWIGCTLHDLIQPSFSFLVGTAMAFSLAKRAQHGQSRTRLFGHALWRSLVLIFLGIFLRSMNSEHTNYTFEDTLTQIGLGYPFLFLLGLRPRRDQWIALVVILIGIWAAFALYPLPDASLDYASVGVSPDWLRDHGLTGFAAHWQKNTNLAWAADRWFLNLFPRETPFSHNGGGYATLSFIPTLGTMILGLIAGGWLRDDQLTSKARLGRLVLAGVAGLAIGWGLGALGVCPVVKRIWTPSWTLFSGGWCFLILAAFHAVVDMGGLRAWTYPLRVIGANSIAAYLMSWLFEGFIGGNLERHLGTDAFRVFGTAYEPLVHGAAVLLVFWLILWWMNRNKIYLKI